MTKQLNAIDLLKEVVQHRNWHQGKIDRHTASVTKLNVLAGKASYEKCCEVLSLLGWAKVQDESWEETNP